MVKNPPANAGDASSISGSGRFPGVVNGNPLQLFLSGKFHEWRGLVGCSPWGHRVGHDWDWTELEIEGSSNSVFSPGNTDDAFRFRKQGVNFPLTRTALLPGRDGLPFLILQAETSFSSGIRLMVWIWSHFSLLTTGETSGKFVSGDSNSTYLTGLLWVLPKYVCRHIA